MSFTPIQMPTAGLLGFNRRVEAPTIVPPAPKKKRAARVTLHDVFVRTKPKQKQVKAPRGQLFPGTMRGRVLVALCLLAEGKTKTAVRDDALVVLAWTRWPEVYGLGSLPYPDSTKVRSKLCGVEGLIAKKYIVRVAENTYQLTRNGAAWWRATGKPWLDQIKPEQTSTDL